MTGSLNMAIYASMRAVNDPDRLGTSMVDLLGAPSENDQGTREFAQRR